MTRRKQAVFVRHDTQAETDESASQNRENEFN
jgi:hypothetical protein